MATVTEKTVMAQETQVVMVLETPEVMAQETQATGMITETEVCIVEYIYETCYLSQKDLII